MLDERRHVIAYDLRGHGRSPWSGAQTLAAHCDDLEHVLETCGVDQAVIIGHSLGARIAVEFAEQHGERVTALVLLDPPLFAATARLRDAADAQRAAGGFGSVDEAIDHERAQAGLRHTPRALLAEEMAEHLVAAEDGSFRFRYSREAAAAALDELVDSDPRLKELVCPTLVVRADESELLTEDAADRAMAELRRGRLECVPGGHGVLWDALAETSALVCDFVFAGSPA